MRFGDLLGRAAGASPRAQWMTAFGGPPRGWPAAMIKPVAATTASTVANAIADRLMSIPPLGRDDRQHQREWAVDDARCWNSHRADQPQSRANYAWWRRRPQACRI